jgi:uncharacterized Zn finger protein
MARESADDKARRLLTEGRLIVRMVGNPGKSGWIVAECRGDSGDIYTLGYDPKGDGEWRCQCPNMNGTCSHLAALKLVVVRD